MVPDTRVHLLFNTQTRLQSFETDEVGKKNQTTTVNKLLMNISYRRFVNYIFS